MSTDVEMTVVGRTGHMEDGEYVEDTVTVRVQEPGGWAVTANDKDEEKARARGRDAIEAAKEEMRQQVAERVAMGALTPEQAAKVRKDAKL